MIVSIYIGNDKLSLQEDESISITSSINDIEDITKNTTDYSKSFTVPANDINNKIFKHYYNANIDNTFDARIKVDGRIELYNLQFRIGKFLLQKVIVKKGVATSYTINFFGNLVSVKDAVGKDELKDLDLSAFNHAYNSDNVKLGLEDELFNGDIIYNLLVKKRYYYNSDITDVTQDDTISNIGYTTFNADNGILWNDLRPSIKLIKIIEAIETDYSLQFSRDFFGRSEFTELFIWMTNDKGSEVGGGLTQVDFVDDDGGSMNLTTNTLQLTATPNDEWGVSFRVFPNINYGAMPYTIRIKNNDEVLTEVNAPAGSSYFFVAGSAAAVNLTNNGNASETYNLTFEVEARQEFVFTTNVQYIKNGNTNEWYISNSNSQTITSEFTIANNLPKLKIIDFLKGLFKKYKLVVIPQDDGIIYVNTLKDYYLNGTDYDITEYIDFKKYDVERGSILNEISYKFADPITILNKEFKELNGLGYGDEEALLKDANGEMLDGDSLTIELPFEQFVYERLVDVQNGEQTNIVYGAIIDDKLDAVNPKAHIFYNLKQDLNGKPIGFFDDTDVKISLFENINIPSHVNNLATPNFSTVFSEEYNEFDGKLITNTLYTNYHKEFIDQLFNIKRRNFTFDAPNLPINILLSLQLNDLLKIKNNYYRIEKFTSDIVKGIVQFNLVNSFDINLNGFSTATNQINFEYIAGSKSAYVTNLDAYSINKIDDGFGISWVTITDDENGNLIFTVTENEDVRRNVIIDITRDITNQNIRFYITQDKGYQKGVLDFSNTNNGAYNTLLLTGKI